MKRRILIIFLLIFFIWIDSEVSARDEGYKIGPRDIIEISVWKDESLSREVLVPPDGVISFPLIGDIRVRNMTVAELREVVSKRLNEFVPDATVTVMLLQINSLAAYVIGKVNKPGIFPIDLETNVMQVLAMAGGLTPFASPGKILVLRQQDGKIAKLPFDYKQVEKGSNLEQNIILKRGDVVVVP
jgi:polysaccharide export outer membrane protein